MNSLYRGISLAAVFWTTVSMSAYTPHETGSRTTASGARAKEGYTCAANFVPMGSVIFYEGHKYVVQDRMNPKYNRHVDIFMESHKKALQFGRKNAKVQVITPDDKQVKLPKENKHKGNRRKQKRNQKNIFQPKKQNRHQNNISQPKKPKQRQTNRFQPKKPKFKINLTTVRVPTVRLPPRCLSLRYGLDTCDPNSSTQYEFVK